MCGIAGFFTFNRHDKAYAESLVKRMTDTLLHRGPDEEGFHTDEYVALGHRRLSIIDLSSGQQPMATQDEKVWIVFNGEIYNFPEIRSRLEGLGYRFRTKSDTEAILLGYLAWGEQCVEKLHGMFAFAIWDGRNNRLFLARDRVGKKPLYYFKNDHMFAFASELKALRVIKECPSQIDPESLDCYFTFGYIPAPRTIYRGVKKLQAAHSLMVGENVLREQRYWQLSFAKTIVRSMDDAIDEFSALLDDAVRCRLMSEVPLGVFLSGGIDSPLVVSSMAGIMDDPVLSNSIGFDDEKFNELPLAKAVSEHLNTDHREFFVRPDALNVLEKIAWHFDEPFADSSAIPTWYVCQMARENVTVALSGDGGDESFGGYTFRYIPHMLESRIRSALPVWLRRLVFGGIGAVYPGSARLPQPLRLKTIFENLAVSDEEAFYHDLAWLRSDTRERLYNHDFLSSLHGFTPFETVRHLYDGAADNPLSRSQNADIHFYLTDDVLVKVDRMSMAHSLEVRSPLLDHRVMEFAATLTTDMKINRKQGKALLRNASRRRLPETLLNQPKRGFSVPAAKWLRDDLKPIVEQTIHDANSLSSNVLNKMVVQRIWDEHKAGARDHSVFLWGVMMLGMWEKVHYSH